MARSHGKILVQVWRDRDWTGHTIEAQWLYWLLLSQPKLTLVGSLEVTEGRWVAFAGNGTRETVQAALSELEDAGKVIIDHQTGELLIRTFTTHDLDPNRINVNLAKGLWGQWACIASDDLRRIAVLLIPDATWEKLEPHAPSDAAYIRRSARLEPGGDFGLRPVANPRLEPPPSSLLPTDTSRRPGDACANSAPVDNPSPVVIGLANSASSLAALCAERNPRYGDGTAHVLECSHERGGEVNAKRDAFVPAECRFCGADPDTSSPCVDGDPHHFLWDRHPAPDEQDSIRRELLAEAIRGFLMEKHLPFDLMDEWADEIVAIVREHEAAS